MRIFHSFLFITLALQSFAQTTQIEFAPKQPELGEKYQLNELKFYVGHLTFYQSGKIIHKVDEYHLVDLIRGTSTITVQSNKDLNYDSISFEIGVDSTHNVAGILEGALDPSKGMYWSWQSGYINFKIEAMSHNKMNYIYHLGGYMWPFACNQKIGFSTSDEAMKIDFLVNEYLDKVAQTHKPKVMSPGQATLELSEALIPYFRLAQ